MRPSASTTSSAPPRRGRFLHRLVNLAALQHLGLGLARGGLCWALIPADFHRGTRLVASWDGFCLVLLALTWIIIPHPATLPHPRSA